MSYGTAAASTKSAKETTMRNTAFALASLLMILHSPPARAAGELLQPTAVISNVLQLSAEQTQSLVAMIQSRETAVRPLAESLQAKREALGKLVETANPDPAAVGKLILDIRAGEKEVAAAVKNANATFESKLTEEQQQRLQFVRQSAQVVPVVPAFQAAGLL
jgi:Spy/CpxP family protein refolding chaperone